MTAFIQLDSDYDKMLPRKEVSMTVKDMNSQRYKNGDINREIS